MRFFNMSLIAGGSQHISAQGSYFRVISSESKIRVTFQNVDGSEFTTKWIAAIGAPLDKEFKGITIVSEVDQDIEIAWAKGEIHDNRLAGNVDITGGIRTAANRSVEYGPVEVNSVATLIREGNGQRSTCLLQNLSVNNMFVANDNLVTVLSGIKLAPGKTMEITFDDDIYGIATGDNSDLRFIEESL